ncbi:MAG: hypothetical protein OXS29_14025 [bacterium]|nr:hypothetical protein [bacterium]MDE0287268.1 hypothetical protein [bacterium]MDE0438993.1 hypothetical protein [bacterium]
MTIRPLEPLVRTVHIRIDLVPVAGFAVALAAGVVQSAWWFGHGWTWSNLPRFLMSGEPVAWCVILILAGACLSWVGLRRTSYGQESREWAVAGLVISAIAAIPIMLGVLLLVLLMLLIGACIGDRARPSRGRSSGTSHPTHAEASHWGEVHQPSDRSRDG